MLKRILDVLRRLAQFCSAVSDGLLETGMVMVVPGWRTIVTLTAGKKPLRVVLLRRPATAVTRLRRSTRCRN